MDMKRKATTTQRKKNEMILHWIVTAFRYGTGEHYAIICSDALQASMVFSRACAVGNMYGEPNRCTFSDSQEKSRFINVAKKFDGIHLTMRSVSLMGNYSHDITEEERNAMIQLVARAFPDEDNEQEKTAGLTSRSMVETTFKNNRISKIEKIRL